MANRFQTKAKSKTCLVKMKMKKQKQKQKRQNKTKQELFLSCIDLARAKSETPINKFIIWLNKAH